MKIKIKSSDFINIINIKNQQNYSYKHIFKSYIVKLK